MAGDTNGAEDIFVRDLWSKTTTRVSVSSRGDQANSDSWWPDISASGRYVVFSSNASDLVPGDTNATEDVFVHDIQTGHTSRVSVADNGAQANGASSGHAQLISASGRYVVFYSDASNLVRGDTNRRADVFVRDRLRGTTVRISMSSAGQQGNDASIFPSISATGRVVAYSSHASNLVPGDTNRGEDEFVYDMRTGLTQRVSVSSRARQANSWSGGTPRLSASGRFVSFYSTASNLVRGDTNGVADIFVRDLRSGITLRVSVSSSGAQASGESIYDPPLSGDGRLVAFQSDAENLAPGDDNWATDIFLARVKP